MLPLYQGPMPFCTILLPFLQDCTSDGYLDSEWIALP